MSWIFLPVAVVERLQAEQINAFGGSHGLRDAGLLESAVMRAENKANDDPSASIGAVAALSGVGPRQEPRFHRRK